MTELGKEIEKATKVKRFLIVSVKHYNHKEQKSRELKMKFRLEFISDTVQHLEMPGTCFDTIRARIKSQI